MSEAQTPVEPMPPASRLGEILGWSLLTLAAACFTASIVAIVQAHAASLAMRHTLDAWVHSNFHSDAAYTAYMAANAAHDEATLRVALSLVSSIVFLSVIPGLLYAMTPSLLGGPWGLLLRPSARRLVLRQPPRRHPVTFYQGSGLAMMGIGAIGINLLPAVDTFFRVPTWFFWVSSFFLLLLWIVSLLVGGSLMRQATWRFLSGRAATPEQERPQA